MEVLVVSGESLGLPLIQRPAFPRVQRVGVDNSGISGDEIGDSVVFPICLGHRNDGGAFDPIPNLNVQLQS